ncbi:synaptojanin-1 [Nematostella vectensis]|uniref:synaptojanin-1 n=1 Tax=Nematostella vectensis TaxID=45351 RepID=UPI0020775BB8|nr:synaptojanin-1 [Nematostella vectensis]
MIGKSYVCYSSIDQETFSILLECKNRTDTLLFESGAIALLSQWETEAIKKNYQKILDAYGCLGVLRINIDEEETIHFLILVTGCKSVGKVLDSEIFKITSTQFVPLQVDQDEEGIAEIVKLLNSGTFYFATGHGSQPELDLSLSAQQRYDGHLPDNRFMWNRSLHFHVQRFGINCSEWLFSIMCGGVEIRTVYAGVSQAKACLISRLSCERAGTRFYVRGTDDDGHVANFVETEQMIALDDMITSFVQTRGSVPVFWEQPGIQVGSHKVKLSRGFEAASAAFDRHITTQKGLYGDVCIVNLLGMKEGENALSRIFQDELTESIHGHDTPMICFDYHRNCKGGRTSKLKDFADKARQLFNSNSLFFSKGGKLEKRQKGVMRSNCLDCIDRTNNMQTFIGLEMLLVQLQCLGLSSKASLVPRFQEAFTSMWSQNGDHISRIYIGTGALDGKARVASKLRDGARSVKRTIRSNFLDGSKQEAIDLLLLGNTFVGELGERARALLYSSFLHSSPRILRELCDRHLEYTTWSNIRVCVGTWNVNGGRHFRSLAHKHQTMHDWLLDFHKSLPDSGYSEVKDVDYSLPTDIFAIGFEELVDLNASNMVSTSSTQRKEWGEELRRVISRDFPYVLLTCEQLVGVCLFVFARPHLVPYIRDVAVSTVKTGLGGSAGNKGGVAIRLLLHATSICFICSHLAAGQSGVQDRNNDYLDIATRTAFPMGRTIRSHDYVFWCGDFNYRIDMPMDEVKSLIQLKDWDALAQNDQLNKQRQEHKVFRGYVEGELRFAPTYKYDLFSDDYDTSEKMRIPAWTDRVLWRRRKPRYKSADHVKKHVIKKNERNVSENLLLGDEIVNDDAEEEEEDEDDDDDEQESTTEANPETLGNIHFHPGKVLYYGKAELKTSDHRPVVGLIEVEIQKVDWEHQHQIHDHVMQSMGPADPTVVVSSDQTGDGDEGIDVSELLEVLEPCGDAVLVRVVDEEIIVTFDDGRSALKALELDGKKISGKTAKIRLKCDSSLSKTDLTLQSVTSNTSVVGENNEMPGTPLRDRAMSDLLSCSASKHSTLPVLEPIRIQSMDAEDSSSDSEKEEEEEEELSDDDRPEAERGAEESSKQLKETCKSRPQRPAQPKRVPPPRPTARPKRPNTSIHSQDDGLVGSAPQVNPSEDVIEDFDPLPQKAPKPRRPPPPKRPERPALPKTSALANKSGELPRAVNTSKPAGKEKHPKGGGRTQIGMPFNVQHIGHVSIDNFQALLEAAKDDPKLLPSFMTSDAQKTEESDQPSKDSESKTVPDTVKAESMPVPASRQYKAPIPHPSPPMQPAKPPRQHTQCSIDPVPHLKPPDPTEQPVPPKRKASPPSAQPLPPPRKPYPPPSAVPIPPPRKPSPPPSEPAPPPRQLPPPSTSQPVPPPRQPDPIPTNPAHPTEPPPRQPKPTPAPRPRSWVESQPELHRPPPPIKPKPCQKFKTAVHATKNCEEPESQQYSSMPDLNPGKAQGDDEAPVAPARRRRIPPAIPKRVDIGETAEADRDCFAETK